MVRSAVSDDRLLSYLHTIAKQNPYTVGLILGQVILTSLSSTYAHSPLLTVIVWKRLRHTLRQNTPYSVSGCQRPTSFDSNQRHRRGMGGGPCPASHPYPPWRNVRPGHIYRVAWGRPEPVFAQNQRDLELCSQAPGVPEIPIWQHCQ